MLQNTLPHMQHRDITSRFLNNSEASASELLENIEKDLLVTTSTVMQDMFLVSGDLCNRLKSSFPSRFYSNFKALSSELLENIEEMFPLY